MYRKIIICFALILMLLAIPFNVYASSNSYTHVDVPGGESELRISREMYAATTEINASSLEINNSFEGITDVFSNDDGKIYLLCGDKSRLVRIDHDLKNYNEIIITDSNGDEISYKGARGIFCDEQTIYIADTLNSRIILCDLEGRVFKVLGLPESNLIPDDFSYQPIVVGKDTEGYLYILSMGSYYGALLYTPQYEFMGFYGANTVESTALDTLSYLWDKITSNDEKKSASVKKLPYSFADFSFDSDGYMVTCTGALSTSIYSTQNIGQIRKISPNGANILYRRDLNGNSSSSSSVNFLETERADGAGVQEFVSIDVDSNDYIYALDRGNCTIYVYDTQCNLLGTFGGGFTYGNQLGFFEKPVALTLQGNKVIIADSEKQSLTIFEQTEYGECLCEAQALYNKGNYDEAEILWKKVLSFDRNCQLAYRGLAMVYYNKGDYDAALEAAKIAVDYSVYDLALKEKVSAFFANNFAIIVPIVLLLIVLVFFIVHTCKKKNIKIIKNASVIQLFRTPFHPFQSFEDIKYKKLGSVKLAIIITALFYVSSVLNVIASGFLYSQTLLRNYNALYTLAGTVGLILLWSISNWLVCSMFEGKGNLSEVFVTTCYSLLPLTSFIFLKVVLSHFLPLSMSGIITGLETVLLIYTLFLICVAMMKIHDFDFFKVILSSIVVILFMILVVFVVLMCSILITECWSFITSIYEEVVHR